MKIRLKGIFHKLRQPALQKSIPFHMPGHKRNMKCSAHLNKLGIRYDITEIPGYDNLHDPKDIIYDAMKKAEMLWNSKYSFFLVNGSTCGILAAISSLADPGDKIIVARNSHKSVYNAIELLDLQPVFLNLPICAELSIPGSINPEIVYNAISANPDAKMVFLTSPTYEGVISDIQSICDISHKMNIPVVVDEAHGAHLKLNEYFNNSAVSSSADIVIQSLHKTLPSLTQTAIAHICTNTVDRDKFQRYLSVFQTSSPSYLLMASIEGCIDLLLEKKDILYSDWIKNLDYIDANLAGLKNIRTFYHGTSKNKVYKDIYAYDRSKLIISTDHLCINGKQLFDILVNDYNIFCEMYSNSYVLVMTSMCDKKSSIRKLCAALTDIDTLYSKTDAYDIKNGKTISLKIPERCMGIRTARKEKSVSIPILEANGYICAEYLWAYPPGIPYLIPGEKVNSEMISVLTEMINDGIELKSDYKNKKGYLTVLNN
ncbi:MAG: aminotransferase class I/II-fold pyridoxal phosphate-dependent enzyme [Clostridia bacterium]|jgi:arginine/lysine/ornithine decarboxylase|nr:aminotransferase class V-fold PLP-dependent enzyme [Clostridia bacterium]MDD4501603.1 aminotransferase class V-fold PLP-dependent enzyme [Clostridia bacterium]NLV33257.1 aminotransferase class V-fold PLP-dependent enzyme [Clostridiaceae bacterium]HQM97051.1 aminotransferase class V-fold PLP-dependent enzyme [Clostridia bacterium]